MSAEPTLFVIDDDRAFQILIQRAFAMSQCTLPIVTAHDGVDALERLRSSEPDRRVAPPFVILLDLRMPRMDGFEFLQNLRNDADLQNSIVFILSTSESERDRTEAYRLNATGYLVKPMEFEDLVRRMGMVAEFARTVELPGAAPYDFPGIRG